MLTRCRGRPVRSGGGGAVTSGCSFGGGAGFDFDFTTFALGFSFGASLGFDFGFARQRQVIPVRDEPGGALLVALGNPLDTVALDDLRMVLQRELEPVAATPSAVSSRALSAIF